VLTLMNVGSKGQGRGTLSCREKETRSRLMLRILPAKQEKGRKKKPYVGTRDRRKSKGRRAEKEEDVVFFVLSHIFSPYSETLEKKRKKIQIRRKNWKKNPEGKKKDNTFSTEKGKKKRKKGITPARHIKSVGQKTRTREN